MSTERKELEQTILACLLTHYDETINDALTLSANDFTSIVRKTMFNGIVDMHQSGIPVDVVTVAEFLSGKEHITMLDIVDISESFTSYANFDYYVSELSGKTARAELNTEMQTLLEDDSALSNKDASSKLMNVIEKMQTVGKNAFTALHKSAGDALDLLTWRYDNPNKTLGIPTGFIDIDKILGGLQKGLLYLIGARPSHGKTLLGMQIARNFAADGKAVGVVSTEMSATQLYLRLLFSEARVDGQKMNYGELTDSEFDYLIKKSAEINKMNIFINEVGMARASSIIAQARRLVSQHDIELLVVDYLQLLNEDSSVNRNNEIGKISRMLKLFAQQVGIPVIALSQLGRNAEGRVPKTSDLRDSGTLEQDADAIMFIYRPEQAGFDDYRGEPTSGLTLLSIPKHRNGRTGETRLTFIDKFVRFENYISDTA